MPKHKHHLAPDEDVRGFLFEQLQQDGRLMLRAAHRPAFKPISADWTAADVVRRIRAGRNSLLGRAIGLHKQADLQVLDATAGLGRDGFVIAALGARVTLAERNPTLVALLRDALEHAKASQADIAARLEIVEADAAALMRSGQQWDVIHLDPMYPHEGKQALPQKEMQILRDLTGGDPDADALLPPALQAARRRVVVKRPAHARFLDSREPNFQLRGTQARYDVYLPVSQKAD